MSVTVTLRNARSQDMAVCADILNDWIDTTEWMPRVHSREDVLRHYMGDVMTDRHTLVAADRTNVRGFVTLAKDGFISAIYVARESRNQGVGGLLLERAKRELAPRANIYVFQSNAKAQAFCGRHGFVEINRTTGDNEENLPDVLMEWCE